MLRDAVIEEEEYKKRVRDLISRILQAAFKSKKDLKTFLNKIVETGAEKTEAKSCDIFLLEESEDGNGRTLRAYATSGEVGETLKEKKAEYYVPKREPFKDEGKGKALVLTYLKKYLLKKRDYCKEELQRLDQELKHEGKSLMDVLRKEKKSLMDVIKEMGEDLKDLVENEELPMGITAFVVKTGKPVIRHGENIREHPEWRGSYEGAHEICTSLVEVPLTAKGKILGMIKIENHKEPPANKIRGLDKSTIWCFTGKHKEILMILADSVIVAIENVLYVANTYKRIFGTEILRKINELEVDTDEVNKKIHKRLKEFYGQLKIEIQDIGGIDEIYYKMTRLISDVAQILDLRSTLDIIDNVGPAFESLLGTDVRYREHFLHQFQVFLLGYYLINKKKSLREILLNHLKKIDPSCDLDDVLTVWFVASMFHDFAYSVGKMETWLRNYFERVKVPDKFQIGWADIFSRYEVEKTNLVQLIFHNSNKSRNEIATLMRDVFIDDHDHGLMSGLILMNTLHKRINKALLREACCAIALHTDTVYSKFGKLEIDRFPFAFLLVYCDNTQQWGRPRVMASIPDINVKLENIVTGNCTKVQTKLRYPKLTDEQRRIIETKTALPTQYWYSKESLRFSVKLYEGDENEPFRHYIFPFDEHDS